MVIKCIYQFLNHSQSNHKRTLYIQGVFSIFEQVIRYNLVWGSLRLINHEGVYEKRKLFQTRIYKYNLFKKFNIPYNLIFSTKFNDSTILITIISCDYLNLTLANEYVGDVTIPTQVIKYNQNFLQVDQPIRLKYSN